MPDPSQPGACIFISYAHEDEDLKLELDKHLKVLKRSSKVQVWSDREIGSGEEWNQAIKVELDRANIILLLISVDFNASDFIWDKELAIAMTRHKAGTARVVPVILRNCDWHDLPYAALQALPLHGKPVTEYSDRDLAYTEIAQGIEKLVDDINEEVSAKPS
jgi:hypothetical protein